LAVDYLHTRGIMCSGPAPTPTDPPWSELGRVGPGPDSVQGPGPTPLGPEPTHFVKFVY